MPDDLTWFWDRLDSVRPVFLDHERAGRPADEWDRLVGRGLVRETTPALHASCRGCAAGRMERVRWLPDARAGAPAAWVACPHCGPARVAPESLRQWTVDVPALLSEVAAGAGARAAVAEVVPNHLWHVGTARWCGRAFPMYFARFVHGPTRAAFRAAVAPYPRAVVLHPTEHAARVWRGAVPNPGVALESAAAVRAAGVEVDEAVVAAALEDAGLTGGPAAAARRPPRKRATRAVEIERLTAAVVDHLRSAREHAYSTLKMTGTAEWYPRPSQKHFADLLGVTEYSVTRCFQDESARELNVYWGMALDLGQIMTFAGRVGAGPDAT